LSRVNEEGGIAKALLIPFAQSDGVLRFYVNGASALGHSRRFGVR